MYPLSVWAYTISEVTDISDQIHDLQPFAPLHPKVDCDGRATESGP